MTKNIALWLRIVITSVWYLRLLLNHRKTDATANCLLLRKEKKTLRETVSTCSNSVLDYLMDWCILVQGSDGTAIAADYSCIRKARLLPLRSPPSSSSEARIVQYT